MILEKTIKTDKVNINFGLRASKEVNRGVNLISTRESLERCFRL